MPCARSAMRPGHSSVLRWCTHCCGSSIAMVRIRWLARGRTRPTDRSPQLGCALSSLAMGGHATTDEVTGVWLRTATTGAAHMVIWGCLLYTSDAADE